MFDNVLLASLISYAAYCTYARYKQFYEDFYYEFHLRTGSDSEHESDYSDDGS